LLESNKNLILTGAPGTGKTYLARQMAKKLTQNKGENIGFVQFHPSYDYTDFVEGLRPIKDSNGNIVFERKDGIFKEFCKKASEKADEKFVFIIDEINRGEISKIFGELFFSIDPGYRGEEGKIKTQYQNLLENTEDMYKDGFFIPENVYIIGTMNDIDRSVESMDFAFRRRFAFQEITAEDTMDSILYKLGDDMNDAVNKMRAINSTLDTLGLNSNYHIGAAYFKKVENSENKSNKWNDLWNLHLKGTLFEYFRGEPDADNKIEQLKDAYDNANKENNK
jgi:5-methylcytosine-specific restriction protein B